MNRGPPPAWKSSALTIAQQSLSINKLKFEPEWVLPYITRHAKSQIVFEIPVSRAFKIYRFHLWGRLLPKIRLQRIVSSSVITRGKTGKNLSAHNRRLFTQQHFKIAKSSNKIFQNCNFQSTIYVIKSTYIGVPKTCTNVEKCNNF